MRTLTAEKTAVDVSSDGRCHDYGYCCQQHEYEGVDESRCHNSEVFDVVLSNNIYVDGRVHSAMTVFFIQKMGSNEFRGALPAGWNLKKRLCHTWHSLLHVFS